MTDRPDIDAPPDLVPLVGSRIAHDLANPIGAIANGIELLGLTGLDGSPELALIAESVANASARIKLFRIAFGAAAPGQIVPRAEIAALLASGEHRLTIDWQVPGDVPRIDAKPVLLALMCLETALPWGGLAQVRRAAGGLHINATADRLKIDPDLWAALDASAPLPSNLGAAQIHFALLNAECTAQARPLRVTRSETSISLAF
jgi:histidine phosphotransferase ChpT